MELDLRLEHPTQKPLVSFIHKTHSELPVQLDLFPFTPVPRHSTPSHGLKFPLLTHENVLSDTPAEEGEDVAGLSSPNSIVMSLIHMEFSKVRKRNQNLEKKLSIKVETDQRGGRGGTSSKRSDEEENVTGRKKLRLSKEQSDFLEESFKEHHTLNPKQKLVLAKKLSLRPRQVEVWFQNRRARTKLKQTEVDCEYLRRRCETLREENRRLQKELQELKALNNSTNTNISNPFQIKSPATTLTMCPSCERVVSFHQSKTQLRNTTDTDFLQTFYA